MARPTNERLKALVIEVLEEAAKAQPHDLITYDDLAGILNDMGAKTSNGQEWNYTRAAMALRNWGIKREEYWPKDRPVYNANGRRVGDYVHNRLAPPTAPITHAEPPKEPFADFVDDYNFDDEVDL